MCRVEKIKEKSVRTLKTPLAYNRDSTGYFQVGKFDPSNCMILYLYSG